MYRSDLPRVYEIRDRVLNDNCSGTYFDAFDKDIASERMMLEQFRHIEAELSELDQTTWAHLRDEAVPLFKSKDKKRSWEKAFDRLNEAKGYSYLKSLGCEDVIFIPRSSAQGAITPDLQGRLGSKCALCEVKTINPSDLEAAARRAVASGQIVSGKVEITLSDGMLKKLKDTLEHAKKQMKSYCSNENTARIVYVVLSFNDRHNSNICGYLKQIRDFVKLTTLPGHEIVFHYKPKYYSAKTQSSPGELLIRKPDGSWTSAGPRHSCSCT